MRENVILAVLLAYACQGCGKEGIKGEPDAGDPDAGDPPGDSPEGTTPCDDEGDCDDGDVCTSDLCEEGWCRNDPLDLDGDGHAPVECGGDDCDDGRNDVYGGAPEVCLDGVDQDCDTIVDGPRAMLSTVHLKTLSTGTQPVVAWTGSEFAVTWTEFTEIYMGRVGLDGELVEEPASLVDMNTLFDPSMAWTGSALGIVFYNTRAGSSSCTLDAVGCNDIHFMQISPEAEILGTISVLNDVDTLGFAPEILWTGSEFGVFWEDSRDDACVDFESCQFEMYFTRVGMDGVEIDTEQRVTNAPANVGWGGPNTGPAWTGSEYVVTWLSYGTEYIQYLSRLGPDGTLRDEIVVEDPIEVVTWAGSRLGVAWDDDEGGSYDVYLGFLDPMGSHVGSTVRVTDDIDGQGFPNMLWTGSTYGVVWLDGRDAGCSPLPFEWLGACHAQIYMDVLDAEGATIWDDVKITYRDSWKLFTSMAWTGSEFGLAWFEVVSDPDEEWYISFDRISFCD